MKTGRSTRGARRGMWLLLAFALVIGAAVGAVAWLNLRGETPIGDPSTAFHAAPGQIERGRQLALAGNCAGCHTAPGGANMAGGVGIPTPFGTIFAGNLTSDEGTGIGKWSADHFWRAMHNGRSRDGRLLYPAFPYTSFTQITREDSDALFAWLRSLPPVQQAHRAHTLRFPYNSQAALAVWRALYFTPGGFVADTTKSERWNRGAYLVGGLGHCIACHGSRNALGATDIGRGLSGGLMPAQGWYAPALDDSREAGVMRWSEEEVVQLLRTGRNSHASVSGPMAEVVYRSTQHLPDEDLRAMADYLRQLPDRHATVGPSSGGGASPERRAQSARMLRGERIYAQQCAWCHGDQGEGKADAFPALAGNRAVMLADTTNLVQIVRRGGYAPATSGNPRPYGMPPFGHVLNDDDVAAVLSYVRGSWGNSAPELSLREAMHR